MSCWEVQVSHMSQRQTQLSLMKTTALAFFKKEEQLLSFNCFKNEITCEIENFEAKERNSCQDFRWHYVVIKHI